MIQIQHLSKNYGSKKVLSDIQLSFPTQKITSLIGPNGAGKSTLLMMIARLLEPTQGQISLGNKDIQTIELKEYAQRVATLRQSPNFNLRLTVQELVAFGRFPYNRGKLTAEDQQIIDEALQFLEIENLRNIYIDELSGGQRQMAYLAMTIAQRTDILLLDEPLNNLDMKHAVHIMRVLRRLCDEQGRTVIIVIHDINFAANYSDHVVALKNGKLHFCGETSDVITEENLSDLYELNFEILSSQHGYICNYFNT
jgi:iron complex transport system ATP-binding protein